VSTSQRLGGYLGDVCDLNMVYSPFPEIPEGPIPPLPEFVMSDWKSSGGRLGDKTAIIDGSTGMQRTFDDFSQTARGLAASLHYDFGVSETSTVCLYAPNHVDYLPVTLAVGLCGAKITPVNPLYTKGELSVILERSRSSVMIAHPATIDTALEAARESPFIKHVIVMTEYDNVAPEGVVSLDSIKGHDKKLDKTIRDQHPSTDQHPYLLPYSSGTTGLPKGVCLTHANLVSNLLQIDETESGNDTLISPLPFFHIYGLTVSSIYSAWKGIPVVTMSGRFDLELFLSLVEEHTPTRAHLVPPILVGLAKHPAVENFNVSSLKTIVSAAAPLGQETERTVQKRLGCEVKQAWGMSELSPLATINSDNDIKSGSVGPLTPSTHGKIIDENGMSLGPNEPGELVIKGPQVMMGYMDDPEKTAECLSASGWLRTGDVAFYDEDGHFFIQDRMKELIKVRGFQVAPAELEELLLTNDMVSDCAVIGVPDEESGELPRAYIVLKDGNEAESEATKDQIYEWVKERIAPYKRLNGGIVFKDVIPKSASGKILRRILRDEYAQGIDGEDRLEETA